MATSDRREVRLAVAMNGGVSLAVWMGGIAQQLDVAVRASRAPGPDDSEEIKRWRRHLNGRRVIVDIVGGTSAGGLNGALLATAQANGVPLSGLRELWETAGELAPDKLLGGPDEVLPSLLDGGYFLDQIEAELTKLAPPDDSAADDLAPGEPPLTISLITTATAVTTSSVTAADSEGQPFAVADHRRRFLFTRGLRRTYNGAAFNTSTVNDFGAGLIGTLARAARASASYPAAFAPVAETPDLRNRRVLPRADADVGEAWLADGGILDNEPIDVVIEQMARQPVKQRCDRWLLYVVPSANEAPATVRRGLDDQPPWTHVVGSAFSFPREVNFRSGVGLLTATMFDAGPDPGQLAFDRLADDPVAAAALVRCADDVFELFQRRSARAALTEARALILGKLGVVHLQSMEAGPVSPGPRPWVPGVPPSATAADDPQWTWGPATAERVCRLLLRNLGDGSDADAARLTISNAIDEIDAVRAAVELRLPAARNERDVSDERIDPILAGLYAELAVARALAGSVRAAVGAYSRVPGTPPDPLRLALAIEVHRFAISEPMTVDRTPPFRFLRVGTTAACPALGAPSDLPLALIDDSARKLYGSRLGHFAAFGEPEWRMWDWMWGRLDGVAHLGEVLGFNKSVVKELQELVLASENRTAAAVLATLRSMADATQAEIAGALRKYVPAGTSTTVAAGTARNVVRLLDRPPPGTPEPLEVVGRLVGKLVDDDPPPPRPGWLSRWVSGFWRRPLWKWLNGGASIKT